MSLNTTLPVKPADNCNLFLKRSCQHCCKLILGQHEHGICNSQYFLEPLKLKLEFHEAGTPKIEILDPILTGWKMKFQNSQCFVDSGELS